MKAFIFMITFFITCISFSANAAGVLSTKIAGIQQYGADSLTILYLASSYTSPNNCANSIWGNTAVMIRSNDPHSEKLLSVALAAMLADKRVDIRLVNSCDGVTDKVHYIRVYNNLN